MARPDPSGHSLFGGQCSIMGSAVLSNWNMSMLHAVNRIR